MNSDLSGEPLAGGDAPTHVRVVFDDRHEVDAKISADEAARLRSEGSEAPHKGRRVVGFLARNGWKILVFVMAAWFSSLVIPAVIQQWTDRQSEVKLKDELLMGMSDTAADTLATARIIHADLTPQSQVVRRARAKVRLLEKTAPPNPSAQEQKALEKARQAVENAEAEERKAERTLYAAALRAWMKSGASYEARLGTYFAESGYPGRWNDYRDAIVSYLSLVGGQPAKIDRLHFEMIVFTYVCGAPQGSGACAKAPPLGTKFPFEFARDELLRSRVPLLVGIRDTEARGFNTSVSSFINSVTPIGLVCRCL
jgi:hypothetical protein